MTDKQIIIDGVDVNALYSDQIACMNRYEVAHLFIKTVEQFVSKEQECEANEDLVNEYFNKIMILEDRNFRLKKAITEIKKITEKHAPRCNDNAECDFECEACHLRDLKQILQKCEVLDDK